MYTKSQIEKALELKVFGSNIGIWRIGLTHDLRERYEHWKDTESLKDPDWFDWEADSLFDAQAIEADFIKKGMQGGTGGNLSASKTVYVYIFVQGAGPDFRR